jgi:ABC-type lipoprotein release transport system permease subunit
MRSIASDVAYALRAFRKKPAFAVTAVLTLALGIGAASAIFSVMNAVLLQPLPCAEPQTFAAMTVGFLLIAALACGLPALRASRLDPMVALRDE